MLHANYQAKIWHDFTSPASSSGPLNHGYAIDGKPLLPLKYSTNAYSKFLNQLHIYDKSDAESSDSSNEENADFEFGNGEDNNNMKVTIMMKIKIS